MDRSLAVRMSNARLHFSPSTSGKLGSKSARRWKWTFTLGQEMHIREQIECDSRISPRSYIRSFKCASLYTYSCMTFMSQGSLVKVWNAIRGVQGLLLGSCLSKLQWKRWKSKSQLHILERIVSWGRKRKHTRRTDILPTDPRNCTFYHIHDIQHAM